jgi:hypothetical protein
MLAALPATALASGETLTVAPTNPQAGGLTPVSATLNFAAGEAPETVVTSLAPGMLGNLGANPGCLAAEQLTPSCQIGSATISTDVAGNFQGALYLVPPQGSDAAGIDFVPGAGSPQSLVTQYIGVALNPNAPGGLNLTTTFPQIPGVQITSFAVSFTTLNGQQFTRLPSNCNTATSSFAVTYTNGTNGTASGSFTPTGCAGLPYAPTLSGAITKDAKDSGATLVFAVTQAANESASKSITLKLPSGLGINLTAIATCLSGSGPGCTVGSATATSPLLPSPALASGTVTLGGTVTAPTLSIAFPAPFSIALTGSVNLANTSVTFENVPDVPLTNLALTVTGPSGGKAFTTDCKPATVGGAFTAQSGAAKSETVPVTFNGCVTVTGSTGGLATGHPNLKFKLAHAKGGANLVSVAVGLPGGLRFSRSAFVSHKTCTTLKGKKKKCTTTTLISGLGISGGKASSVALKGGKLVITLAKGTGSLSLTISRPLVTETKSLKTKVKKHKAGKLTFTFKITDAKGTASTVAVNLKPH